MQDEPADRLFEFLRDRVVIEYRLYDEQRLLRAERAERIDEFMIDDVDRLRIALRAHDEIRHRFDGEHEPRDFCHRLHLDCEHVIFRRTCEIEPNGLQVFSLHLLSLLFLLDAHFRFSEIDLEIRYFAQILEPEIDGPLLPYPPIEMLERDMPGAADDARWRRRRVAHIFDIAFVPRERIAQERHQ